ncbi:MAG: S-layer homology domain-containing protein [Clostridia bacterium]|nr:S-layer homology domain-containing protein [Clostridia bacterium]
MKKLLSLFVSLCLAFSCTVFVKADADDVPEPKYYYVDKNAPEGGHGSKDSPFSSVEEAKEMLRKRLPMLELPEGGICIVLAEGEYRFDETLVFTSEDSGRDGRFVTYRGEGEVSFVTGEVGTVQSYSTVKVEDAEFLAFENICFKENMNASLLSVMGNNIRIKGCTFSDSAITKVLEMENDYYGIYAEGWNISIENCEFFNLEGGVMLNGDVTVKAQSENSIKNCYFHDLSLSEGLSLPAVKVSDVGCEITHCEVSTTASSGIVFEGSSNKVINNVIRDTATESRFSSIGAEGGFTTYGNIIENNFIDTAGGVGISLPDGVSGTVVKRNLLKDCGLGIYLGGGRNTEISSNMILGINKHDSRGIVYDSSFRETVLQSLEDESDTVPLPDEEFLNAVEILSNTFTELKELCFTLHGEDLPDYDTPSWYFNPADSRISNNAFYVSRESAPMSVETIGNTAEGMAYQVFYGCIYSNIMMPRGDFSDFPKIKWNNFTLSKNAVVFSVLKEFREIDFEAMGRLGQKRIMTFTDISESDWYYTSVEYAFEKGLMSGTNSDGTVFSPNTVTTRAMLVQMLYNLEGAPEVEYSDIFEDVKKTDWCSSAVMWAYQNGITSGTGDGRFDPSSPVTREQIAVFLYRYINEFKGEEQEISGELDIFGDKDDVSPYAGFTEAVSWAVGCGIISGKNEFGVIRLAPRDMAQRCETAAIIARFHEGFVK